MTREELQSRMKAAAGRPMTAEQIREQKISFVMGTLGSSSKMTREEVTKIIDQMDGVRQSS